MKNIDTTTSPPKGNIYPGQEKQVNQLTTLLAVDSYVLDLLVNRSYVEDGVCTIVADQYPKVRPHEDI